MVNIFIKSRFVCGFGRHLSQRHAGSWDPCPRCPPLGESSPAAGATDPFGTHKVALGTLTGKVHRHATLDSVSGGPRAGILPYATASERLCLDAFGAEQLTPQRCSHHCRRSLQWPESASFLGPYAAPSGSAAQMPGAMSLLQVRALEWPRGQAPGLLLTLSGLSYGDDLSTPRRLFCDWKQ